MTQSRHEVALALRELKGRIASRTWVPVSGSSEGAVYVTTGLSPVVNRPGFAGGCFA